MYSEQNCFQKWQFLKYFHLHISFWMTHPANQLVGCIIQKRTATFRFNFVHNVYIMSDGMAVIELQQPFFVQLTQSTLNYAQKRGEIVASVLRPRCGDIKTRFTFSSMRCLDTVDVSNRVGTMIFKQSLERKNSSGGAPCVVILCSLT